MPLRTAPRVVVVGAGPAGLGAATRLSELGVSGIVVVDRERLPGGLPAQCDHRGFGVLRYRVPLKGADFAARLARRAQRRGIDLRLETTVLSIGSGPELLLTSPHGVERLQPAAVIVATGCRESPSVGMDILGSRPAGIFNTAVVQRLLHEMRLRPGREAVIYGSEDVGLMAVRQLATRGISVKALVDEAPYLRGYKANYVYSVWPFRVPVYLGHRITAIDGEDRVRAVEMERTADGAAMRIACDCLVLSGRFIPESTVAREAGIELDPRTAGPRVDQYFRTTVPGVFACGNILHGAESSDIALLEGEHTAEAVAGYLKGALADGPRAEVVAGLRVGSVVPQQFVQGGPPGRLLVRPDTPIVNASVEVSSGGKRIARRWRPWALPHRSLKITIPELDGVPDGQVHVALAGRVRAGSDTLPVRPAGSERPEA